MTTVDILEDSLIKTYGKAVKVQNYLIIPELKTEIIIFRFYKGIDVSPINIFGDILKIERKDNSIYRINFSKHSNFIIESTELSVGLFQIISLCSEINTENKIWDVISSLNGV